MEQGDVHEIMICAGDGVSSDGMVDSVAYVGFVEIMSGGYVSVGDAVAITDTIEGTVLGFDETHSPNHLNIVVAIAGPPLTGRELGASLEDPISFRASEP